MITTKYQSIWYSPYQQSLRKYRHHPKTFFVDSGVSFNYPNGG